MAESQPFLFCVGLLRAARAYAAVQKPVQPKQDDEPPSSAFIKEYKDIIPNIEKVDDVVKRILSLEMASRVSENPYHPKSSPWELHPFIPPSLHPSIPGFPSHSIYPTAILYPNQAPRRELCSSLVPLASDKQLVRGKDGVLGFFVFVLL